MHLTLFVPGLLLPGEILADTVFDLTAPSLSLILGRGQRNDLPLDWLAGTFGLTNPLPAAALRKVGAGGTASGEWLCLDPVHLQVSREGISLADPIHLDLTAEESAALIEAMQPLFATWGELSASHPLHWELRLHRSLLLDTRALADCIGLAVDPELPAGLDGQEWRRLLAEAQTILHAHQVNRQREALGKPLVNSLWPWGQGKLPEKVHTDYAFIWSDDPVIAGLSAQVNIPCIAPPPCFQASGGEVMCHLASLVNPARMHDALAWRHTLMMLERDWLAPSVAALKKGECKALRLIGTDVHGTPKSVVYSLVRGNLWRFWRRPLPLTDLI
jgi:hypothetical protein